MTLDEIEDFLRSMNEDGATSTANVGSVVVPLGPPLRNPFYSKPEKVRKKKYTK